MGPLHFPFGTSVGQFHVVYKVLRTRLEIGGYWDPPLGLQVNHFNSGISFNDSNNMVATPCVVI